MAEAVRRLGRGLGPDEETAIAAITASELLHGVHRATAAHRPRRAAFVEGVLEAFPLISFDLSCARAHALLWADLAVTGKDIGAHDRLVAATAVARGWRLATVNVRHFNQVPGLNVIDPDLAA
jgi:tRNA(fMet)-specific endonuclease VapC